MNEWQKSTGFENDRMLATLNTEFSREEISRVGEGFFSKDGLEPQ